MSNVPNRVLPAILIGLSLLHAPAICAQSSNAQITGSIVYRERVALPADAAINVQLQDVSLADVAAQVVAETMLNAEGRQVPIPFTLSYDPAQIDPSHRYSVRATIRSGDGMLMFTTAQAYPVLTHGSPSKVSLVLRTVGHGPKPGAVAKQKPAEHTAEPLAASAEKSPASEAAPASSAAPDVPTVAASPAVGPPPTPPSQSSQTPEKSSTAEDSKPAPQAEQASSSSASQQSGTPATEKPEEKATQQPAASVEEHAPAAAVSKSEPSVTEPQSAQPATKTAEAQSTAQEAKPAETPAPSVAEPRPPEPESKPAEAESAQQKAQTSEAPAPSVAEPQALQPRSKPVEAQAAPPEARPSEQQAPLPDSPSTVAGLTAPEASPEQPEGEAEPESRPARPKAETPLADTQWKLIQLGGIQVVVQAPDRPLTLAFSPEGRRIAGSAGCHTYIGTFTDDHGRLTLNPGDMAAIGCPAPIIRREQKFVAAMHDADGYRVTGDYLVLTSKGKTLAKFKNQLAP